MNFIIALKNITRSYTRGTQQLNVLNNINLSISRGELVAITGASGSGKSTLMNIIGCLDVANEGSYCLDGENVANLNANELARIRREHIGFIFQRYHLMSDLSALGNVEMPAVYAGTPRDIRRMRSAELLSRLGLAGREHHKPGELSGGQQQRVCIARALINGGEIILADEPTGALDSRSGQDVLAILCELNRRGHTVVIVTHDLDIARHARRIIELRDGEIIADSGPSPVHLSLLASPAYCHRSGWRSVLDNAREALGMALKSMNAHRLRTLLTMTGIIFGIAAVVTVVALGEGARQHTLENMKRLGNGSISIYPGRDFFDEGTPVNPLVPADSDALRGLGVVDSVSPEIRTSGSIRFHAESAMASVTGVGRDYFHVNGIALMQGQVFHDDRHAVQEVIIDEKTRQALFGATEDLPSDPVVLLDGVPLRVVGVARNTFDYAPNMLNVWVPYRTVMYRMTGKTTLDSISVRLKEGADNEKGGDSITQLLAARHGMKDFRLFNNALFRQSMERTSLTLRLLILMIASIALMIGSLGVMNIMLVSVTERTQEIGVRMAVGARRGDIMCQFMAEAVMVCLTGGVLGILLSLALSPLFTALAGGVLTAIYSWQAAVVAFFCSTLIGMIFGYLPARKAARMDPVISLASE